MNIIQQTGSNCVEMGAFSRRLLSLADVCGGLSKQYRCVIEEGTWRVSSSGTALCWAGQSTQIEGTIDGLAIYLLYLQRIMCETPGIKLGTHLGLIQTTDC